MDGAPAQKTGPGPAAAGRTVTAGELAAQAQAEIDRYEVTGEIHLLESARSLFDQLARELGPQPFDPPVAGLAEACLLRYLASGNVYDLLEAHGLSVPSRHTIHRPPPQVIYVQARALHLLYKRTGSVPLLDGAIDGLAQLNAPGSPAILKCVAAYAEALLDRYHLLPDRETLRQAREVTSTALSDTPPLSFPGAAAALLALGRTNYEVALGATKTEETYDGAPVVFEDLHGAARAVVDTLRRVVNSLERHSPLLPLALSRYADGLVLLSRFKESQEQRSGLREEAVGAAQMAAADISPHSPYAAAIRRSVANALRWQAPDNPAILEVLEQAAKAGVESDLADGLAAALDWAAIEPVRASIYVNSVLHRLQAQLQADGKFRMDLLQDSTSWVVKDTGGEGILVRWHGLRWVRDAAAWPARAAVAWAGAGQTHAAIQAIEDRPILALDCGRSGDLHAPTWSELGKAAQTCPLVYLAAGRDTGYAFILDPLRTPAASTVPLPGFTVEAVGLRLHGELYKDEDIEGVEYSRGYIGGNLASGGLIQNYASWQARNHDVNNNEYFFRPLDDCGKWLGETVLARLEATLGVPAGPALPGAPRRELVLIPTGQVSLLPVAAAWLPDATRPAGRRYLADAFTVRFAPSARVLLRAPRQDPATFVGVADPDSNHAPRLAFAGAEVGIAASTFTQHEILAGSQATGPNTTAALSRGSVVHLACHAMSHFSQPLDSSLSLAADDRLYLWQLAGIDFSGATLVVLSSCESATVTRQAADQSVSLASALLGAGARAVIASTWIIADPSTAILMMRFYYAWRIETQPPAAALQTAQQWLRDTTNSEKLSFCESLLPDLGGKAILDVDAVSSIYRLLSLEEPEKRSYAHPYYWAALSYFGL